MTSQETTTYLARSLRLQHLVRVALLRKRFLAVITLTLLAGSPAGAQVVRGVMTVASANSA